VHAGVDNGWRWLLVVVSSHFAITAGYSLVIGYYHLCVDDAIRINHLCGVSVNV